MAAVALSRDRFLGGRLEIDQPQTGYRAGIDPVLLAASVPARAGEAALELGCGAGVASLCLGHRVPGLRLAGLELQPLYADLARQNALRAGLAFDVHEGNLAAMPPALRATAFDHVLANPPYFRREAGTAAQDGGRDTALAGATPLEAWIGAAASRLRQGGCLTMIQRAERLPETLAALAQRFGAVEVLPLCARSGRPARLVLVRARKGRRSPFRLLAPVTLHQGARHLGDGDDYAPDISAVLRDGAAMPGWAAT